MTNTLGHLIDTWDKALGSVRETIRNDLRALDLSDYAFLAKFRLEVENMPLGAYLLEAYGDIMRYRLEESDALLEATADVDRIAFGEMPPAHFLPQAGVNLLSHAVNFVNGDRIAAEGTTMVDAANKLQLGDIVAKIADIEALTSQPPKTNEIPVQVVISQVCDLQQGKAEDLFLLEGTMSVRSWAESIKAVHTRVDCFLWKGMEFTINWNDSSLKTWSKRMANARLHPERATHWRIARLRPLPALKAQQLFAARLTRIGTLASPHMVKPVSLAIDYLDEKKKRHPLFNADEAEKMACLLNGAVLEEQKDKDKKQAKYQHYLVFSRQFPRRLAERLLEVVDEMNPAVRADVREFATSEVAQAALRQPRAIGKSIEHKTLKIDLPKPGATASSVVGIAFAISDKITPHP